MAQAPAMLPATQTDPLAQLRDIHLPLPVESWPPAPGWWLLMLVGIGLILAALYWSWRSYKANGYRRDGIRQLDAILRAFESHGDIRRYLEEYQLLLKRVALTCYDRDIVASLSGEAWVAFLDKSTGGMEFSIGEGQVLIAENYVPEPQADVQKLNELGRFWIRQHHDLPMTEQGA